VFGCVWLCVGVFVYVCVPACVCGMVSVVGYLAVSLVLHASVVALEGILY